MPPFLDLDRKCESLSYRCTSVTRPTSGSTILHLEFRDLGCSGTQASHRLDSRTWRSSAPAGPGKRTPFVRRLASKSDLVLEITARWADGHQVERQLVLEKQEEGSYEGNR